MSTITICRIDRPIPELEYDGTEAFVIERDGKFTDYAETLEAAQTKVADVGGWVEAEAVDYWDRTYWTGRPYAALIPNLKSGLYPTFGVDVILSAEVRDDGEIGDMEPVEWLEGGAFDAGCLPQDWTEQADKLAAVAGWRILWDEEHPVSQSEYREFVVERVAP